MAPPSTSPSPQPYLTIDNVLQMVAMRPGSSRGVDYEVLKLVWSTLCEYVESQLLCRKGVLIPGFAHILLKFIASEALLWGTKTVLVPTLIFLPCYVSQFCLGPSKQKAPAQQGGVSVILNYCYVATMAGVGKDVVNNSLKDIHRKIGELAYRGNRLSIDFGFSKVLFSGRKYRVVWNTSFTNKVEEMTKKINNKQIQSGIWQGNDTYTGGSTQVSDLVVDVKKIDEYKDTLRIKRQKQLQRQQQKQQEASQGDQRKQPQRPPSAPPPSTKPKYIGRRPTSAGSVISQRNDSPVPDLHDHIRPPSSRCSSRASHNSIVDVREDRDNVREIREILSEWQLSPPVQNNNQNTSQPNNTISGHINNKRPAHSIKPTSISDKSEIPIPPARHPEDTKTDVSSNCHRSVHKGEPVAASDYFKTIETGCGRNSPALSTASTPQGTMTAYQRSKRAKLWYRRARNKAFKDAWDAQLQSKLEKKRSDDVQEARRAQVVRNWIASEEQKDMEARYKSRAQAQKMFELNVQMVRDKKAMNTTRDQHILGPGDLFGSRALLQPEPPDLNFLKTQIQEKLDRSKYVKEFEKDQATEVNEQLQRSWKLSDQVEKESRYANQQRIRQDYINHLSTSAAIRASRKEADNQDTGDFFFQATSRGEMFENEREAKKREKERALAVQQSNMVTIKEHAASRTKKLIDSRRDDHFKKSGMAVCNIVSKQFLSLLFNNHPKKKRKKKNRNSKTFTNKW